MIEIFGREILLIGVFSQKPTATGFQWISQNQTKRYIFVILCRNWIFFERNSRFWITVPAVLSLFPCLYGSTWLTGDDSDSSHPGRSVIRYRIITNAGTTRGQNIWGGLGGLGSGGRQYYTIVVFLPLGPHIWGANGPAMTPSVPPVLYIACMSKSFFSSFPYTTLGHWLLKVLNVIVFAKS